MAATNYSEYEQKLQELISTITIPNESAYVASKEHWMSIAKPLFSLGKLEQQITQIAGILGKSDYKLDKKALIIMCADNGVVAEGVTQSQQQVTAAVTSNFKDGKTSVCYMAKRAGCDIYPVDLGVAVDVPGVSDPEIKIAYGTKNMAYEPAMTRSEAVRAILTGISKVKDMKNKGYNIIATGEMGIGNTTTSSAIATVLLEVPVETVTGRGAGLSSDGLQKKINTIRTAIEELKPDPNDMIDVLSKVGGLDIGGLVGVFLGGAIYHIPIVIDGFISATAALVAKRLCTHSVNYMLASHVSKEPAGHLMLDEIGLSPVITADMCLGEGTGAVALFPLLEMVLDVYTQMDTFDEWNGEETYEVLV